MRIAIIGAGLGGLAAGAYLSRLGHDVHIHEQLHQAGGYVHTFTRKGYTFESSTHQLNGFNLESCFAHTTKALGIDQHLTVKRRKEVFEILFVDQNRIARRYLIRAGYENALADLTLRFPKHDVEIRTILDECRKTAEDLLRVRRLQQPNPLRHPLDLAALLLLRASDKSRIAKIIGTLSYPYLVKYKDKTFDEISSLASNSELRCILSQLCHYVAASPGTAPAYAIAMITYLSMLEGPVTLVGGTISMIRALVDVIYSNSGQIHFRENVTAINTRNGRVQSITVNNLREEAADIVISNGSAYHTYNNLVGLDNLEDESLKAKVRAYEPSHSVFQIYLGLPFDLCDYGFHASTMIFNHAQALDFPYVDEPEPQDSTPFIMTNFSGTNPEFNAGRKSSIVVTEFDRWTRWRDLSQEDYRRQKQATQDQILNKVQKITGIPFDRAEVVFSGSPRTMSRYSADEFGGIVGARFNLAQTGSNRFAHQGPFENLFLVGADSASSAGVGNCLDSGVVVGRLIEKLYGRSN